MARGRKLMSTQLKIQLARELGIEHAVEGGYFGNITSRDCGALVRQAIRHAENVMAGQGTQLPGTAGPEVPRGVFVPAPTPVTRPVTTPHPAPA